LCGRRFGKNRDLHVCRVKQGTPSTHPILGDELRALRRLQRDQDPKFTTDEAQRIAANVAKLPELLR
jgi:hypothetical protein